MGNTCYICGKHTSVPEVHHIYLQAYGGTDGPTVILCSNHHSMVHTLANQYPNGLETSFLDMEYGKGVALVKAIIRSKYGTDRTYKVVYRMNALQRYQLGKLKIALSQKSLESTVSTCVAKIVREMDVG